MNARWSRNNFARLRTLWWRFGRPIALLIGTVILLASFGGSAKPNSGSTPSTRPCTVAAQSGPVTTHALTPDNELDRRGQESYDDFREQQVEDFVAGGCRVP
ncbi:MAG: hypothetical protein QOK28_1998 [Actinomycetota bacterium]|jgi:hypothetical protein